MNVRYIVALESSERQQLQALAAGGTCAVRRIKRAQILLAADAGRTDEQIANTVQVSTATIYRTKRRFVEDGMEHALSEDPRPGGTRKLSTTEEAMLVALACSSPPKGWGKWTLDLLADEMVRLTPHEQISRDTIGRRLDENDLKPWQRKMWCISKVDSELIRRPDGRRPRLVHDPTGTWHGGGLLRRNAPAAHWRGAPAGADRAGTPCSLRLRVPPQRYR
jgi:transposase